MHARIAVLLALVPAITTIAGAGIAWEQTQNHAYDTAIHEYEHCKGTWGDGYKGPCNVTYVHPENITTTTAYAWVNGGVGRVPSDTWPGMDSEHDRIYSVVGQETTERRLNWTLAGGIIGLLAGLLLVTLALLRLRPTTS